jgi:hypothetical protein
MVPFGSRQSLTHCTVHPQIEHVHTKFPHLIDERSFTSWAPHFRSFADAFQRAGVPVPNLIGFIDGKLWPICRPGRYQSVMYSGHKRIHGIKTQGIVFPNGELWHRWRNTSPEPESYDPIEYVRPNPSPFDSHVSCRHLPILVWTCEWFKA